MSSRKRGIVIRFHSRYMSVAETETGEVYQCSMPGKFKLQNIRPIVGDTVEFIRSEGQIGRIENILPRKNELSRPRIANIDQVILVTSLKEPEVPFYILDRFLILSEHQELPTIIVVNKIDLLEDDTALMNLKSIYGEYYTILAVSSKTGENIDKLKELLKDKVSTMAGMSGVGKSSLLNTIEPGLKIRVSEISKKLDRGKHTTTYAQFLYFEFGGFIADTPGFASLELPEMLPEELSSEFRDINEHQGLCAFSDCNHINEPDCYVKELVESGDLAFSRYESYVKMHSELQEKEAETLKRRRGKK